MLLFLPVGINSELTLLVAREDFIKRVSPMYDLITFSPSFSVLCFSHIIPYIRFYVVSFSSLLSLFLPSIHPFFLPLLSVYFCPPHFSLFLQYFVFTAHFVFSLSYLSELLPVLSILFVFLPFYPRAHLLLRENEY